jgi:hypothetical protein
MWKLSAFLLQLCRALRALVTEGQIKPGDRGAFGRNHEFALGPDFNLPCAIVRNQPRGTVTMFVAIGNDPPQNPLVIGIPPRARIDGNGINLHQHRNHGTAVDSFLLTISLHPHNMAFQCRCDYTCCLLHGPENSFQSKYQGEQVI